jgi:hypothetical protein
MSSTTTSDTAKCLLTFLALVPIGCDVFTPTIQPQPPTTAVTSIVPHDDAWLLFATTSSGSGNPYPDLHLLRTDDFETFERVTTLLDFGVAAHAITLDDRSAVFGNYLGFDTDGDPFRIHDVAVTTDGRTLTRADDPPDVGDRGAASRAGQILAAGEDPTDVTKTVISTSVDGLTWVHTSHAVQIRQPRVLATADHFFIGGEGESLSRTSDGVEMTTWTLPASRVRWMAADGTGVFGEAEYTDEERVETDPQFFRFVHDSVDDTISVDESFTLSVETAVAIGDTLYGISEGGLMRFESPTWIPVHEFSSGVGGIVGAGDVLVVHGQDIHVSRDAGATFNIVPRSVIAEALGLE